MLDVRGELGPQPAAESALSGGEAVRQLNFRELTYRRFIAHPLAKWALLGFAIIVVACYGAPLWHLIAPNFIQTAGQYTLGQANQPPSLAHLFGTDSLNGHDIFSLCLFGGELSIFIGVGSMIVGIAMALIIGGASGFIGGPLDAVLMRIADLYFSVPILLTVPLATRVFGHASPITIAIIFGIFSWPGPARIVRSYMLSLREQQFTEAARALGVSSFRIIYRHLLPNAVGPILVSFTLGVATNIILEAFVSFLGFGLQPPTYSWGTVLSNSQQYLLSGNWWWTVFPGLCIVLTVLCINFIGDGLRDALDPRGLR